MRPGYFRLRRCPLIYHQKSGQKRGGLMEIIQKTCPGYPGSIVVPLYTTRKTEQMETVAAYFFEKPPLTNRDILGCFSDWPSGNFSKSFYVRQLAQPGPSAVQWRGKTFSHYQFLCTAFFIATGIAPTIKPTTSEINPFKSAICFMLSKKYVIGSASSLIFHPGIK